jgi:hypothetical protein
MKVKQRKDGTHEILLSHSEIRGQIKKWLQVQGVPLWYNTQSALSYKGLPDLEGVIKHIISRHFYIEVKAGKDTLSKKQKDFKKMVEAEGEKVFVVHGLNELIEQWKEWCGTLC